MGLCCNNPIHWVSYDDPWVLTHRKIIGINATTAWAVGHGGVILQGVP